MGILEKYAGQRRLYAVTPRMTNPRLNHEYIERRWLDVPYADGAPRALMDIYLPNADSGPFPVILFIHGGGYFTGDKGDYETYPPLEGLKRGYAICAINYTLSGEALFPKQIQEGKAALRFIRANARKYNLDTSCVIAWGMSAGANLAAILATTGDKSIPEFHDSSLGNPDESTAVDACMIWFCPTDIKRTEVDFGKSGVEPLMPLVGGNCVWSWYFGMPIETVPDDLAQMTNPETYLDGDAPPFVIQHGKVDAIVPYVQSVRLAERLRAAIGSDRVRLMIFDDYRHADRRFETMHNCSLVLDDLEELLGRKQGRRITYSNLC